MSALLCKQRQNIIRTIESKYHSLVEAKYYSSMKANGSVVVEASHLPVEANSSVVVEASLPVEAKNKQLVTHGGAIESKYYLAVEAETSFTR